VKPDCMKHDLKVRGMNKRRFSFDNPEQGKAEAKQSVSISEQRAVTANMMALKAWPTFLLSEEYQKWISESGAVKEENDIVTTEIELIEDEGLTYLERLDREFEEIVTNQSWLVQLLQTVESLPLCVSIATARRGQRGFPLVYVNQFFETTTGYTREEILGQNCRFLQQGD
jgi:PAS domain-containing protein